MKKEVLANGLKVLYQRKPGNAVVIQVMVDVGSNHETEQERGIAHFLEHILFEGTSDRPTNREISNEIEKIGGEFNAYTTNERTCYYVKVLKKHFSKGVEVLADILQNSLFKKEHIAKEKNIVLKEIAMILDEPRYYQWVLLQQNLFKKHPCRFPTYGSTKIIKNLKREQILNFFHKYYAPNNMTIAVVGDVPRWKEEITKRFTASSKKSYKRVRIKEPRPKKTTTKKEKRKIVNTYLVMGFQTKEQHSKDSYVLEVINGILGRGQSGRMFTEIRSKRGLAYDVGTQHIAEPTFGYFAIYTTIDKKNVNTVKKLVMEELNKLQSLKQKDLKEAKDYVEGDYLLELENIQKIADQLLFWEQVKDANLLRKYVRNIKKVTLADVRRVAKRYFNNPTVVVLEGK